MSFSRLLLAALVPVLAAGCGFRSRGLIVDPEDAPAFRVVSVTEDTALNEMLSAREQGWLGSDVAWSIPVSAEKSVWLFGDTLIGEIRDGKRDSDYFFINSSLGIQDRRMPMSRDAMSFHWGSQGDMPASFFPWQEETPGDYYWSTMGVLVEGELFIFCYAMDIDAVPKWIAGTALIRIANPLDDPSEWVCVASDFGLADTPSGYHSAVYVEEPWVYFFGRTDNAMRLARGTTDLLTEGGTGDDLEFLTEVDGVRAWSRDRESLAALYSPSNTETGVHFEEEWGLYFMTTYTPSDGRVYVTCARDLRGPWSEPVSVYEIPEHEVSFPILSYAMRPHPELSTKPGELVITYNTNAYGDIKPLFTEEGLRVYQPRAIRVQVEPVVENQ